MESSHTGIAPRLRYYDCRIGTVSALSVKITVTPQPDDTTIADGTQVTFGCPADFVGQDWMGMWADRVRVFGDQISLLLQLDNTGTPVNVWTGHFRCNVLGIEHRANPAPAA